MSISSVTVTFNPDIVVLKRQLISLQDQLESLIIVDNGSDNAYEIESLAFEFDVNFHSLGINRGLSFAQNTGIAIAKEFGSEFILLLDQDSVLDHLFVQNMYSIYTESGVGILGPVFYDPISNKFYKGTNYFGPFIKTTKISKLTDVTYVIASGSFFSTKVFDTVGPMNESLFVDYIDVDWSLRAKAMGYRVAMTDMASMSHTIGDSRFSILGKKVSLHGPYRRYFLVRNSFFMVRQTYVPLGYKLRELTLNFARTIISFMLSNDKTLTLKMALKGIRDGILGCYGPYRK